MAAPLRLQIANVLRFGCLATLLYLLCPSLPAEALQEATPLKPRAPVTRELAGGQKHEYQILLVANQYLRVTLDHFGFDASLALFAPDGAQVFAVEGNNDNLAPAAISALTQKLGAYRIVAQSREKDETARAYKIEMAELRAADNNDEKRIAADRLLSEAEKLRAQQTAEARQSALKQAEESLQLRRQLNDRAGEAGALMAVGRIYQDREERRQAIEYYRQALNIRRELGERMAEAASMHTLANAHAALAEVKPALEYFEQALQLRRELQDRRGEAATLQGLGNFYGPRGQNERALEYYEPALRINRELQHRRGIADALAGSGRAYIGLGQADKGIACYEEALTLYRGLGNRVGEASVLQSLGLIYNQRGQRDKAIEALREVLPLAENNQRLKAQILSNLGSIYNDASEKEKALEYLTQALEIRRAVNDKNLLANTLNNLGDLHSKYGERQQALAYFEQAILLAREGGNSLVESAVLNNSASVYRSVGEKQQALELYQKSLALLKPLKRPVAEAIVIANLGLVYGDLGDREHALENYNQALQIHQQQKNVDEEVTTLNNLGSLYFAQGEKERALEYFNRALDRQSRNPVLTIYTLNDAALVYNELGQPERAREYLQRALESARKINNPVTEATTLHNLGWVEQAHDNQPQAREYFDLALRLKRQIGDRAGEAATMFGLARTAYKLKQLDEARAHIEAALEIVEALRSKVVSQDLRTSYFASIRRYYDFYLDVLMQLDQQRPGEEFSAQALQASERARARSLLEMLAEARADIRQGVDEKLVARERELQDLLNGKSDALFQFRLRRGGATQAAALTQELNHLTNELAQVRAEIRQQSPRYAKLTQPQPLSLREIQEQVLDDGTLLLEYALGEERSYLWAITKQTARSYVLPKRTEIEQAAERVYQLLTTRNQQKRLLKSTAGKRALSAAAADAQYWRAAAQLSRMVLQPVAAQLRSQRLLIVSEGALQYVPFGALPIRNQQSAIRNPLMVKHEIISLPSASALAMLRQDLKGRQPAPKQIAIFADPVFDASDERVKTAADGAKPAAPAENADAARALIAKKVSEQTGEALRIARLPFTRTEAERIANAAGPGEADVALGFRANRAALLEQSLNQYRIVHIATHGLLNTERPELSALVFSLVDEQGKAQDGFLRAHEVFNLNLPAELVVLSACETGLGKQIKGEGLVGLTRGFMYARAARIVVSLWAVSDEATAELMSRFYQKMLREKQEPAAALRAAQIELWRTRRWQAPYYWAGFVLQGEWK